MGRPGAPVTAGFRSPLSFPSQSLSSSFPSAPPAITKSLEPVVGLLSNTVTAKLTSVEATLKDNVTKVVKSKVSEP